MFDELQYIELRKDVYQKNLEVIRAGYPEYAKKIEEQELFIDFHLMPTGKHNAMNVYSVKQDRFLYDTEDPYKTIKEDFSKTTGNYIDFLILYGHGLGYELNISNLAFNIMTMTSFVVIENSIELFKLSLYQFDFTDVFKYKKVLLLLNEDMRSLFLKMNDYCLVKNRRVTYKLNIAKYIYHSSIINLSKDYYLKSIKEVNSVLNQALAASGNSVNDSLLGLKNMLLNMEIIIDNPGTNLLFNKFKGKPAVVVSSGPSLNKNKHLLKGLENKALIICPETSMRILNKMDLKPHIICSVERVPEVVKLIDGFSEEETKDTYLASIPILVPDVYKKYKGPKLIAYRRYGHLLWTGINKGDFTINSSAGNMAFNVAEVLGCDPIILIGQDLAYTKDGKSHAKGAVYGESQRNSNFTYFEVEGNDGKPILTHNFLNQFRLQYEADIASAKCTTINATEGGALIRGAKVMTFAEAIDKYIKEDIYPLDIIRKNLSTFNENEKNKDKETFLKIAKDSLENLEKINEIAKSGQDYIEESKKDIDNMIANESFNEEVLEDYLNTIQKDYIDAIFEFDDEYFLLDTSLLPALSSFYNNISSFYDESDYISAVIFEILQSKHFFALYVKLCEISTELISEAVERLENKNLAKDEE